MRTVKALVVCSVLLVFAGTAWAQTDAGGKMPPSVGGGGAARVPPNDGSVSTTFASNNAFCGNTFDLVSNVDVTVTGLEGNIGNSTTGAGGDVVTVHMYWRLGTAVGNEANMAGWMLHQSAVVTAAGTDAVTEIPINMFQMTAGQVYGIYIYVDEADCTGTVNMFYTNGGPNMYSDGTLTLTTNSGQGNPPWTSVFFPRIWNGTVYYVLGVPALSTWALIVLVIGLVAAGAYWLRWRAGASATPA